MSQTNDQLIELYLARQMSQAEEEAFLQRVAAEPELLEQLKLEQDLRAALDENDWAYTKNAKHDEVKAYAEAFASSEAKALKASIGKAAEAYKAKAQKKKGPVIRQLWIYSAAAAAIFVISFLLLKPEPVAPDVLYTEFLKRTELPSLTTRSADESAAELLRAQAFFDNEEYENTAALFQKLLVQMPRRSEIYIYLAVSQMELGQYNEALGILDQLQASDLLDAPKAYWYQSLAQLKAGDLDQSKKLLELIVEKGYYNQKLAAELLEEL